MQKYSGPIFPGHGVVHDKTSACADPEVKRSDSGEMRRSAHQFDCTFFTSTKMCYVWVCKPLMDEGHRAWMGKIGCALCYLFL